MHWQQLQEDAMKVRIEVFVEEQRIPLTMEQDPADEVSLHALAYSRLGIPVATGRLHDKRIAAGFYASSGFAPQGDGFEEVGLPHIEMIRAV